MWGPNRMCSYTLLCVASRPLGVFHGETTLRAPLLAEDRVQQLEGTHGKERL